LDVPVVEGKQNGVLLGSPEWISWVDDGSFTRVMKDFLGERANQDSHSATWRMLNWGNQWALMRLYTKSPRFKFACKQFPAAARVGKTLPQIQRRAVKLLSEIMDADKVSVEDLRRVKVIESVLKLKELPKNAGIGGGSRTKMNEIRGRPGKVR
jgi:hypothetical protein